MTLDEGHFAEFFAEMHTGHTPFAWQNRLLAALLQDGRWPDRIVAPTGSGKTSAIDVHVFALALSVGSDRPAPPRRLAMVVDRRVLVDANYTYATTLAARLASATSPVMAEVRDRLWALRAAETDPRTPQTSMEGSASAVSPLVVARLRGGVPPARSWRDHPLAAAVLCATPDMWGSRLLFRGYGSTRLAWPREAGLLAFDAAVIVDEAHLARQLLYIARRVAHLATVAEHSLLVPPLQVVETTATPAEPHHQHARADIGVNTGDLDNGDQGGVMLGKRLRRPKPVTVVSIKNWHTPKSATKVAAATADAVLTLLDNPPLADEDTAPAHTVGCFVNTVARAIAVAQELRQRTLGGQHLRVVLVSGQVRPIDIDRLELAFPGLLSATGNDDVDVVVTTQSLEVGVDLDFAGVVTELAAGTALAQRVGRGNRRGQRAACPVIVTMPAENTFPQDLRSGPYQQPELVDAAEWVHHRATDPQGMAPWSLREHPPPGAAGKRMLLQRPELAQAWYWATTSDDLAAEPELDLWLSDDLDADTSIGLLVRDLPEDIADARRLIRDLPPQRHEVFSVPLRAARNALASLNKHSPVTGFVVREDTVDELTWTNPDTPDRIPQPRCRPGDIVVVDTATMLFTAPTTGFSPPVLVPMDENNEPTVERHSTEDVLEARADLNTPLPPGGVVHRIELAEHPDAADLTYALDPDNTPTEHDHRAVVLDWLAGLPNPCAMQTAARDLLTQPALCSGVIVHRDGDQPRRILIVDRRRAGADEDIRQEFSPSGCAVTLLDHQRDVADRAHALGCAVITGDDDLAEGLRRAGQHHDDGKQDPDSKTFLVPGTGWC